MQRIILLATACALLAGTSQAQPAPQSPIAYRVEIRTKPPAVRAGEKVQLEITVRDSATGRAATSLQTTHEKIFHLYIIHESLEHFAHEHAEWDAGGFLRVDTMLPRPGLYRLLSEFHPAGAEEQAIVGSLLVGEAVSAGGTPEMVESPTSAQVRMSLRTEPSPPQPATKSLLFFDVEPAAGLAKFEGDWGQLLAVSDDLIDVIHLEPFAAAPAGPGKPLQFNYYFPRARRYRLWPQVIHDGKTVVRYFDVEVKALR